MSVLQGCDPGLLLGGDADDSHAVAGGEGRDSCSSLISARTKGFRAVNCADLGVQSYFEKRPCGPYLPLKMGFIFHFFRRDNPIIQRPYSNFSWSLLHFSNVMFKPKRGPRLASRIEDGVDTTGTTWIEPFDPVFAYRFVRETICGILHVSTVADCRA